MPDDITLDEPIEAMALFGERKFLPLRFCWQGRAYSVRKVHGKWRRRDGQFLIYSFALTAHNGNIFEIEFHTRDMQWRLARVYSE